MSRKKLFTAINRLTLTGAIALLLSGCVYDYFQRTDRVSYSSGDAVKANIERETTDPSDEDMNNTSGLGKNGVIPPPPVVN